jgi:hypothetical protein
MGPLFLFYLFYTTQGIAMEPELAKTGDPSALCFLKSWDYHNALLLGEF